MGSKVKEFQKFDQDKSPLFHLGFFRKALEGVCRVSGFGAEKYGLLNWKKCEEPERYISAAMRHLLAHIDGEELDPESGMPHLWSVAWNILATIEVSNK